MAGNNIKPILTSVKDGYRPESDYSKHNRTQDPNFRWRQNNVIKLDVDKLESTSQQYIDTTSKSKVIRALCMEFDDVDQQITVHKTEAPGNPYKNYSDVSAIILSLIASKFPPLLINSSKLHFQKQSIRKSGKTQKRKGGTRK